MANAYRDNVLRIVSVAIGSVRGDMGRSSASWNEDAGPGEMLGHFDDSKETVRDISPVEKIRNLRNCMLRKVSVEQFKERVISSFVFPGRLQWL